MTSRRLVVIRHSKAADGEVDLERPLAPRGVADAAAVREWLESLDLTPDRVVVSPSLRTRQTWHHARPPAANNAGLVLDDRVYDNTTEDLLAVIRGTPEAVHTLVLVGHNPSVAELVAELDDGSGDAAASHAASRSYPTSGVAVFDVVSPWPDVTMARLASFRAPRGRRDS